MVEKRVAGSDLCPLQFLPDPPTSLEIVIQSKTMAERTADYDIEEFFMDRWSPRSFTGEPISDEELMTLFEAARWAPSCYNDQPWRFLYAKRDTPHWETFLELLAEGNRLWARNCSVLIVAVSSTRFAHNGKPNRTHSFDTGSAWQNLALQASLKGLAAHGMAGFNYDKAAEVLHVPDDHQVEAMIAVGRPGKKDDLPEKLREREKPSGRRPVSAFVMEGSFAQ